MQTILLSDSACTKCYICINVWIKCRRICVNARMWVVAQSRAVSARAFHKAQHGFYVLKTLEIRMHEVALCGGLFARNYMQWICETSQQHLCMYVCKVQAWCLIHVIKIVKWMKMDINSYNNAESAVDTRYIGPQPQFGYLIRFF